MRDYARELRAAAEGVAAQFAADPRVEGVLLTGSVSLGRCDAASDVDMSIYYSELPSAEELEALVEAAKATGGGLYSMDPKEGMACYSFIGGAKVDTGHGRTAPRA